MKFNSKGLIVTGVGLLVLWAALSTRASVTVVDDVLLIVWAVFLVLSSVAIVGARLHGRAAIGELGAILEIRRWILNRRNR